jgi:hypothetical protein
MYIIVVYIPLFQIIQCKFELFFIYFQMIGFQLKGL